MITFSHKGNFSRLDKYLRRVKKPIDLSALDKFGQLGVDALMSVTPMDSGETANSWYYEVEENSNEVVITFSNKHRNQDVPIAIILQYGHGTGTGGWVEGRDYINPAIQPIFDAITDKAWKEVIK